MDLFWACLATVGAAYPLYRLYAHLGEQGGRDLFALILVLAAYPWATAVLHLTPFDKGLVYAICVFAIPLYAVMLLSFLGYSDHRVERLRGWVFAIAGVLSVVALTNPWHGQFAVFDVPTPGQANHLLFYMQPKIGLSLTLGFEFLLVGGTAVLTAIRFARARCKPSQFFIGCILPTLALVASSFNVSGAILGDLRVNGFFVVTTMLLFALAYAVARNNIVDTIPLTDATIIGLIPDAIVITNPAGVIVDCNPAFGVMFGVSLNRICGKWITEFLPEAELLGSEVVPVDRNGTCVYYDIKVTELKMDPQKGDKLLLIRDVTQATNAYNELEANRRELRGANAELARLSTTDSLTGLRNRRYFQDRLAGELQRRDRSQNEIGVLSIDIDHFKRINDVHGHNIGDVVLTQLARTMENQCRAHDLLARFGGEEFSVLLLDCDKEPLAVVADRFRRSVELQRVQLPSGEMLALTVSVGAVMVEPGETPHQVLQRVDEALYRAKHGGRNQVAVWTDRETDSVQYPMTADSA